MKKSSDGKRAKKESENEAEPKIKSKIIESGRLQNLASYLFIILSLSLIFSFSCAKKKKQSAQPEGDIFISGSVKEPLEGKPIITAKVVVEDSSGKKLAETKTDEFGVFHTKLKKDDIKGDLKVRVEHQGYAPLSKVIRKDSIITGRIITGRIITARQISLELTPDLVDSNFITGRFITGRYYKNEDGTETMKTSSGQAMITGRFITGRMITGRTPSFISRIKSIFKKDEGGVSAEITVGDPDKNIGSFPGDFQASDPQFAKASGSSERVQLATSGWIDITFRDTEGNPVQVVSKDNPAIVMRRIPDSQQKDVIEAYKRGVRSIPWYYYDEGEGIWKRTEFDANVILVNEDVDGDGVQEEVAYAQVPITHTSWYNIDFPLDSTEICFQGKVLDANGKPIPGLYVIAYSSSSYAYVRTDDKGEFKLYVPQAKSYKCLEWKQECRNFCWWEQFCWNFCWLSCVKYSDEILEYWRFKVFAADEVKRGDIQERTRVSEVSTEGKEKYKCHDIGVLPPPEMYSLSCSVKDVSGNPLVGASVVSSDGKSAETDSSGKFTLISKKGNLVLTVSYEKDGRIYKAQKEIYVDKDINEDVCSIVMRLEPVKIRCSAFINQSPGEIEVFVKGNSAKTSQDGSFEASIPRPVREEEVKLLYIAKFPDGSTEGQVQIVKVKPDDTEVLCPQNINFEYNEVCVEGQVKNEEGKGIKGVYVLVGGKSPVITDEGGFFKVQGGRAKKTEEGKYKYKVKYIYLSPYGREELENEYEAKGTECVWEKQEIDTRPAWLIGTVKTKRGRHIGGAKVETEFGEVDYTNPGGQFKLKAPTNSKVKVYASYGGSTTQVEVQTKERGSTASVDIILNVEDTPPKVRVLGLGKAKPGGKLRFKIEITDDSDSVGYGVSIKDWGFSDSGTIKLEGGKGEKEFEIGVPAGAKSADLEVEAKDTGGNEDRVVMKVEVVEKNRAPEIIRIDVEGDVWVGGRFIASAVGYDPDGDEMSYEWGLMMGEKDYSGWMMVYGATAIVDVPENASGGTYQMKVKVKDSEGGERIFAREIKLTKEVKKGESVCVPSEEICDGLDNDCNGLIDDGVKLVFYKDLDKDGYTDGTTSVGCSAPQGYVLSALLGDCNDEDNQINPGKTEICDGIDNNCNGLIDEGVKLVFYKDLDGDGYTDGTTQVGCSAPTGYVLSALSGDCDEGDAQRNPGVTERCDTIDNDCDGQVDEGCACIDGQTQACYTGPSGTQGVGECRAGTQACSNGVWGPCVGEVTPQPELCGNTKDEDCDGNVGKFVYQDQDGDRYAPNNISSCVNVVSFPGEITVGYELGTNDCNDNNASIYPGAPLNCNNGQDNDCSGNVEKWAYTDVDGDRYAPNSISYCVDVVSFPGQITAGSELGTNDCDDSNSSINPSAPDNTCDGIDNNCNLYVDENTAPCFAPTSFGIYSWGLTYVSLRWTYPEPSSNVEKFVIQRSPNGITYVDVAEAPASATNYTIRTYLTSKYYFRVYAKNATGSGSPSSVTSAPIGVNSLFEKTIGGSGNDYAHSITQSSDGGYVVAGYTSSFGAGSYDMYVVKLDSSGNVVWTKTIGGSGDDQALSIIRSSDGNYVVAGWTNSFGSNYDFYVVKLDSSGNIIWTKTIGGSGNDQAWSIIQSSDGGYVVAGRTNSFGAGGWDFYVVKLDSSGNVQWTKVIGGPGSQDEAWSIIQSSDGGYVVAGWSDSFGAGLRDFYVVKLDANGNVVWSKTIGGIYGDGAHSIIQSSDGGYIVAGSTETFGAGGWEMYLVKLDSSGNVQWTKTIGGPAFFDDALSIIQSSDGGYVVSGYTNSFGAGGSDFFVVKLDSSGNVVWAKTIGGSGNDAWGNSIIQSSDGGYVVVGHTQSFGAGGVDFYVVKLAPDGTLGCHDSFQNPSISSGGVEASPTPLSSYVSPLSSFVSPVSYSLATTDIALCMLTFAERIGGSSDDFAYSIIQSSDGGYVVAGKTQSFGAGDYDMYVVKLNSDGSTQWTKTMGGSLTDEARSIIQSSDGGFAVAGNTQSFGAGLNDIYVVKLDSGGNVLWTKTIGGGSDDQARSIIQSSDGGFVVAGWTSSFGAGGYDMYIVKIDGSGNIAWTKTIGGTGNDYAYSIIQDLDRNYVVVGWSNSFGSNNDIYVVKLDSGGNVVWTKTIGGSGDDGANSIIQSSDGAYVIAGHTNSFSSSYDFYVVKIDSSGNVLWTKTIGGDLYDQALSIIQSSDGGYIVVGRTQSFGAGGYDVYVVKIDSSGNVLWTKTIGGGSADEARSIIQSSDGGFAIAGYTQSFGAGGSDMYVVKMGPSGDICWSRGITNYVVSSVSSSFSSPSTVAFPQSPTVTVVSPASGSGGSVSSVCFSAGAPPVPMCLISGGCDYYQAGSDMEKITDTMKGVEREKEQNEIKSYGCSVGGVYKYFILTVILLLYSWFRFRRKKKAKSS